MVLLLGYGNFFDKLNYLVLSHLKNDGGISSISSDERQKKHDKITDPSKKKMKIMDSNLMVLLLGRGNILDILIIIYLIQWRSFKRLNLYHLL